MAEEKTKDTETHKNLLAKLREAEELMKEVRWGSWVWRNTESTDYCKDKPDAKKDH